MRSNTKIWDRVVYVWLQGDGEEAKLPRPSSLIAATKSGASRLGERVWMMAFGSWICQATSHMRHHAYVRQPGASLVRLKLDAPQKTPNSNRGPSIWVGKKDIVDERGLLKTAFLVRLGLSVMVVSVHEFAAKISVKRPTNCSILTS